MCPEPQVILRPTTLDDADAYARWGLDPVFCAAADWTPGMTLEALQRFHRGTVEAPPEGLLRLTVLHDGQVVGHVDLHGTEPDVRELGYTIGPSSRWGRGLGNAAARAGLQYGFEVLDLRRITAEALDANRASVRILQRLGMVETGRGEDGQYLGVTSHYRTFVASRPD